MNKKKIAISALTILALSAFAVGGTYAVFSRQQVSAGNTFHTGGLDLTVDSRASYNGMDCSDSETAGAYKWMCLAGAGKCDAAIEGTACASSWEMTHLGPSNKFFDISDLKPGDSGENTISLHASSAAYACARVVTTANYREGGNTADIMDGKLAQTMSFFAWQDNGNNVWEEGENEIFSNPVAQNVVWGVNALPSNVYSLATSENGPIAKDGTKYIGLAWCLGNMSADSATHKLACDGSVVGNAVQNSTYSTDVTFHVEQAQNNTQFTCDSVKWTDSVPE